MAHKSSRPDSRLETLRAGEINHRRAGKLPRPTIPRRRRRVGSCQNCAFTIEMRYSADERLIFF
jgi:hypothetical protein